MSCQWSTSQACLVGSLAHRTLRAAHKSGSVAQSLSAGGALVDFAELAWTGYVSAVDVASALTQNLTQEETAGRVEKD